MITREEMIVAEGSKQPYWRCVKDHCYSRSIDQPYPFDGILSCGICNAALEFGYWGNYPHWRCTANKRHHQKIFESHLRLPKMLALIPKEEKYKMYKMFGIKNFKSDLLKLDYKVIEKDGQIRLFKPSK